MPFLKIEISNRVPEASVRAAIAKSRQIIHEVKGDPLSMIEVAISTGVSGAFGNSGGANVANVHLTSFGMTPEITAALARGLAGVLWDELNVAAEHAYVFFSNVEGAHSTAWNGRTFAELFQQRSGTRRHLDRRIFGRLVGVPASHPGSLLVPPIPLGDLELELWNPMAATLNSDAGLQAGRLIPSFLGRCIASSDGYFELFFKEDAIDAVDRPTYLELHIFEPDCLVAPAGKLATNRYVAAVQPIPVPPGLKTIPTGHVKVPFYEYDPSWPFPYALPESIRQGFSAGQVARFSAAGATYSQVLRRLIAVNNSVPGGVSIDQVQSAYPPNKTVAMGGESRSDDYFCERMLNSLIPPLFQIDPDEKSKVNAADENIYVVDLNWRNFERRPDRTLLSFRARFTSDGHRLFPHDIQLGLNNEDDPANFTRYVPAGGDEWESAKRVVRSTYNNLAGQVRGHLGATHFGMEQYTIAFLRNVKRNPVRQLLYPFINETLAINERGRHTLIGGETPIVYLIEPMTPQSVNRWVVATLGRHDWFGFQPRKPVCESHGYAKAGQLYWDILRELVDDFITAHAPEIVRHWREVHAFSLDLVGHSLPYVDPPVDQSPDAGTWYCSREIPQSRSPGEKAVHAVTDTATSPGPSDLGNLRQVCQYIIFYSTFVHSWTHKYMLDDLGEIRFSGLLRNGGMGDEKDDSIFAPSQLAALNLNTNFVLGTVDGGSVVKNQEGDAPSMLISRLREHEAEFAEYGLEIEALGLRLNT